jgi:hypothetical protein
MQTRYDTSEWKSETVFGRRLFIYNYAMRADELSGWDLIKTVSVEHEEEEVTEKIHIWKATASQEDSLRISIVETADWLQAHEFLKLELEHCMNPEIRHTSGTTQKAGDVQYFANAEDSATPAAVFFTRGNLQINVRSLGEKPVNALRIAMRMDARLLNPLPAGSAPPADSAHPISLVATPPDTVRILDKLPEFASGWRWLRVEVPDGEVRREGDALLYIPATAGSKVIQTLRLN